MKLPIPDDWDGQSYALGLVCFPDSVQWRALVRGAIYALALGRSWDENTGRITDVQVIGKEIYNSFMACKLDDIYNEFRRLNAIMAGATVTLEEGGQPVEYDYTATGISPVLQSMATDMAGLAGLANLATLTDIQSAISALELAVTVEPAAPAITVEGTDMTYVVAALEAINSGTSFLQHLPTFNDNVSAHLIAMNGNLDRLPDITDNLLTIAGELEHLGNLDRLPYVEEDIAGLRTALQNLVTVEGGETLTLQQILDQLDDANLGDIADLVEILQFLKALVPSFNPEISLGNLMALYTEWRFREGMTNLVMDIAISQRAQATAQGGIGFHALYDLVGASGVVGWVKGLTTKAGGPPGWVVGVSTWLSLKFRPAQIDGWADWVDNISGLLLGSIRGASYDNAAQLEELNRRIDAIENVLGGTYEGD